MNTETKKLYITPVIAELGQLYNYVLNSSYYQPNDGGTITLPNGMTANLISGPS